MSDLLDSDLTPAEIIQQYQVREAVLVDRLRVLREGLEDLEGVLDDEIQARFPGERGVGKSRIYSLLSVPRNMARNTLAKLASLPQADIEKKERT